jgi:hypothetical protein
MFIIANNGNILPYMIYGRITNHDTSKLKYMPFADDVSSVILHDIYSLLSGVHDVCIRTYNNDNIIVCMIDFNNDNIVVFISECVSINKSKGYYYYEKDVLYNTNIAAYDTDEFIKNLSDIIDDARTCL